MCPHRIVIEYGLFPSALKPIPDSMLPNSPGFPYKEASTDHFFPARMWRVETVSLSLIKSSSDVPF